MATIHPPDWKHFEDFAAGIATNRLPSTETLCGQLLRLQFETGVIQIAPQSAHECYWRSIGRNGANREAAAWFDAVRVAPATYLLHVLSTDRPDQTFTAIINLETRQVLAVRSSIQAAGLAADGPRVAQGFEVGRLGDGTVDELSGLNQTQSPTQSPTQTPHETRDLIGLRTWQRYSPEHVYEHTYLNSHRYAWQCLLGVQRGQGDVDLASYWKFAEDQYLFCFREFRIPVASVFFFNFIDGRSTGKFFGLTAGGWIENRAAGAFMRRASQTVYPDDFAPL